MNRTNIETTPWQHDPNHRKGVSYRNEATREHYGRLQTGVETRRDFRGFEPGAPQVPVAPRPPAPQFRNRQTPAVTPQSLDRSRDRSAFGGMDRGSAVQRQSDRGRQSRQNVPSKGTSAASHGTVNHGNAGPRR